MLKDMCFIKPVDGGSKSYQADFYTLVTTSSTVAISYSGDGVYCVPPSVVHILELNQIPFELVKTPTNPVFPSNPILPPLK